VGPHPYPGTPADTIPLNEGIEAGIRASEEAFAELVTVLRLRLDVLDVPGAHLNRTLDVMHTSYTRMASLARTLNKALGPVDDPRDST
jgi:hypothetical protein